MSALPAPRGFTEVVTRKVDDPGDLMGLLPDESPVAWVTDGDGMVGWGEVARVHFEGPDRFRDAARWWRDYVSGLTVDDDVRAPGTGPVAFGSFGFGDHDRGVVIVPAVIVARRRGVSWVTTFGGRPAAGRAVPVPPAPAASVVDEDAAAARFVAAVSRAVSMVRAGRLDKVVVSGHVEVRSARPLDARMVLGRLAAGYPSCWAYAVDGLVGASPELLIRREGRRVRSRVLAGTAAPESTPEQLLGSAKDMAEHAPAVMSVVDRLTPHCATLNTSEPFTLALPNVRHVATEVSGILSDESTSVELAGALHPTAAVAGAPTAAALAAIVHLEDSPRGRYAAPVGWMGANGDGEWCIALRCADMTGTSARLYAGCGVVAASEPQAELDEWRAKLRPAREALGA